MDLLVAVAASPDGMTTAEMAAELQMPRPTLYHLVHTLVDTGMLTRAAGRYVLGLRVGILVQAFGRQLAPAEYLAATVRAIAQASGETTYAGGWWSGEIVTLAVTRGQNPVLAAEVSPGYAGNAQARASGKLLLAYASTGQRNEYLDSHELPALTPHTIVDRGELELECSRIRTAGYAEDREEFALGLCCLAVPLEDGRLPFVITLSAPKERFDANRERYLETMRLHVQNAGRAPADAFVREAVR